MTQANFSEQIRVEFSSAATWGSVDPADEGYDAKASEAQFADSLENHLYDEYPNAEIIVEHGINDRVMVDGQTDHAEVPYVEQIVSRVWEGDSWMVAA